VVADEGNKGSGKLRGGAGGEVKRKDWGLGREKDGTDLKEII